jgi:hypothetical protein
MTCYATSDPLDLQEEIIATNITSIGLAAAEFWNWSYTVTEPLSSNV